jgi:predicted metalloprotease
MTFRRGARLNPGQVRDVRGSSGGGGGGGFGLPGGLGFPSGRSGGGGIGVPAGGGIAGVVIMVIIIGIYFALNSGAGGGSGTTTTSNSGGALQPGPLGSNIASCQTGEDANNREDCRIVGYVNSIQAYWQQEMPKLGFQYTEAQTVLFTSQYQSACGVADTQTGPFYCPEDKLVYLDTNFFNVLTTELGGTSAPLAQAYVVAHEYGHHIQDIEGTLAQNQSSDTGPTSPSVRLELQADCYGGVWAANAVSTGYLEPLQQSDIDAAIQEAKAVGDDWIEQKTGGTVTPDQWTHGSSAERVSWFTKGYQSGQPSACDTFSTNQL